MEGIILDTAEKEAKEAEERLKTSTSSTTTTSKVTTTNVRTVTRTVNGVKIVERITTITYPDGTQEVFTEIL